ncbi:MAG: ABC transporter permease [Caldilineaceae bacterium]|nr:ABC transporter permease [Caldilineaceae bacterium]MBP8109725.1 ABC transporter permease [Caldilineaceae bacterium]MBP8121903.1 ABC transporter permease [Caldilineaceae bacterium]MBP9074460.1 ABC transporter permease [Caldilineaceae bacterium]
MKLIESLRIAMRALAANKMRSILTMLGIIIGVGAVITLISAGQGVETYVTNQFTSAGSNLLFVIPGQVTDGPPQNRRAASLTLSDAQALGNPFQAPDILEVAPVSTGGAVVSRGGNSLTASIEGTTPTYSTVRNANVSVGDFISQDDLDNRSRVAVIGSDAFKRLFTANEYPIGQSIKINNLVFRVIGVMEPQGGGGFGNADETVYVPFTTAQDRLFRRKTVSGDYLVSVIYVSARTQEAMPPAQLQIEEILRAQHAINFLDDDDFSVVSQTDFINIFGNIIGALTVFLGAIAFISLLVGGIGIMNIMLVSVTERTREIGLRKAVGAKRGDILSQFLIEAISLAVMGGIIGIMLGAVGTQIISSFSEDFAVSVGLNAVFIAVGFSTAVGLLFGIYPAYRASRLNPIDALRYE